MTLTLDPPAPEILDDFTRRRFVAGSIGLGAIILTGCGTEDADDLPAESPSSKFPVTIEHARGSTTIESEPKRVVAVGLKDQDTLLALGIKTVGAMDWFGEGTFAKWPWEDWGGDPPAQVSTADGQIGFEKIAALRPDLILGIYQELDAGMYGKLSKIAPTIAQSADDKPFTTPWRKETLVAARAVGREQEGQALIDAVDEKFTAVREQHPEFKDKTAVMVDAGNGKAFVFTSTDPRGQFLSELGFSNPPAIDKAAKGEFAFGTELSDERLDLIDVDFLFMLSDKNNRKKIFGKKLFQRLDVVKRGDVVELPYYDPPQYGAAVAFNTVLSIPYGIDGTLKQIAQRSRT